MNILVACDSFKDSLDAISVCRAIERGLLLADDTLQIRIFPLADGGEGVSQILNFHLGLQQIHLEVTGPLFEKVQASYNISSDGQIAFMEMAQAAGLQLVPPALRNPMHTTTIGVGEMILDAFKRGVDRIILGIGGSATNDLGIGMAHALGWRFLDEKGAVLSPVGGNLEKVHDIQPPEQPVQVSQRFELMCDVSNPLLGPSGAAHTYAKQKGASPAAIELLEKGAQHFASLASRYCSNKPDAKGAGAAGGMGFGAQLFLEAPLMPGVDLIMHYTGFQAQADWADLIITGEGRLDDQTAFGKLIAGVVAHAKEKRVIALCGAVDITPDNLKKLGITTAFSIAQKPVSLEEALRETAENLEKTAFQVGRLLALKQAAFDGNP